MAKTRRKSNGVRRGHFKPKKMGKGWLQHRKQRGHPKPVDRSGDSEKSDSAGASSEG